MEEDLNKYDVEHVCAPHPKMSKPEWEAIYRKAWSLYYTPEYMAVAPCGSDWRADAQPGEGAGHVLNHGSASSKCTRSRRAFCVCGISSERRPGLPRENPWIFWPRFIWQTLSKQVLLASTIGRLLLMKTAIESDPNAHAYLDQALEPVRDDEDETLGLLTQTTGALAAIAHAKKIAELTGTGRVHRLNEYAEFD
jgi:hypothetical protein